MLTSEQMDEICRGLSSKSDKIRALAFAGVAKGDIARYLGIRYQFVYNVTKGLPLAGAEGQGTKAPKQELRREDGFEPLTIAEAKRRLALTLGVDPSSIRITIEG